MPELTEEHKEAMAKGRERARAIRNYLEVVQGEVGDQPDPQELQDELAEIDQQLAKTDDPVKRLPLHQRRFDTEDRLEQAQSAEAIDVEARKQAFVDAVKQYSINKRISYMAWRNEGVPAGVLREADMPQSYNPPTEDDDQ